jgi:hypothetical protein
MHKRIKKMLSLILLSAFFVAAFSTPAIGKPGTNNEPSAYQARNSAEGYQIVFDLFIIRPAFLSCTILGCGGYIITLPFTLIGKNAKYAGKKLVVEPAKWTFTYPLGSY